MKEFMNKLIKNFFIFAILGLILFGFNTNQVKATDKFNQNQQKTEILFFGSPTCPHCSAEKEFLKKIRLKYPDVIIKEYEFSKNLDLIEGLYNEHQVAQGQRGLVPATFINGTFFLGFNENTGKEIEKQIQGLEVQGSTSMIKIPFVGEVDVFKYSMPVLAIILGVIDGFNVCSLGALVIILGLVMILRSRKRILFLGGTFILVTALTYCLLIFLWHQFFVFISPYIKSMEILIALLSIIGGIYLLREFIKSLKEGPNCSSGGIIAKLSPKVEKIFANKKSLIILLGVVALFALAITIIEFPCSAFLPMLFASLLAESQFNLGTSITYMALFLLFYMLDEIIIFLVAFFTLRIKIISPKFVNAFNLIAALIFLFLGCFYLARIF